MVPSLALLHFPVGLSFLGIFPDMSAYGKRLMGGLGWNFGWMLEKDSRRGLGAAEPRTRFLERWGECYGMTEVMP